MNRSILIVICDFLLLSLLTFSTDLSKVAGERAQPSSKMAVATNQLDGERDLAAVMRLALEDEQKRRESLLSELAKTRETAGEREKQLQSFQQQLQNVEQQLQTTEQKRTSLQQQFAAAQTNIETLNQQVRASSTDATISKEKLATLEAELRKRAEEAAALQQRLAHLSQSNQNVLNEKQQLSTQLQVAEVEKRHAAEQVVAMKEQVKMEREEKAKLVEGVKTLATNSTQLAREIRENRPQSPNTIFDEFVASRVRASFHASRSSLFDTNKRRDTGTVLVSDGTNTFALCHVEDTPLTLWIQGKQWEALTGSLGRNTVQVPVRELSFHLQDPRVVFMPVSAAEAQKLGGKVYRLSNTPFKFQEGVLVGAGEGYYGECKFEIDLSTPAYVKLDRSVLKGWFGKFNPSRGDLVFTKAGEFLGIMANNTYCLLIHNFDATATFNFTQDVRAQNTGNTLAALYSVVQQLPPKLQ
jgi:chemotaxis protein histidine kinase CheA